MNSDTSNGNSSISPGCTKTQGIVSVSENYASEDNNSTQDESEDSPLDVTQDPDSITTSADNHCLLLSDSDVSSKSMSVAPLADPAELLSHSVTKADNDNTPRFQFSVSGQTLSAKETAVSRSEHSVHPVTHFGRNVRTNYTFTVDVASSTPVTRLRSNCNSSSSMTLGTNSTPDLSKSNVKLLNDINDKRKSPSDVELIPVSPDSCHFGQKKRRICRKFDARLPSATPTPQPVRPQPAVLLYSLPLEILDHILSFFSFGEICKLRLISKKFNETCQGLLNKSFSRLQVRLQQDCQNIKAQMPRRESARRKHPLVRECDIIETLHMRVTLLQMTFGKHIERKHICFFPGEILDEVFRILRYVKSTENPARAYKVTDELFDLSTMAMEYFKEKLEPQLPQINYFSMDYPDLNTTLSTPTSKQILWKLSNSPTPSTPATKTCSSVKRPENSQKLSRLRQHLRSSTAAIGALKKEVKSCKNKMANQQKQLIECNSRLEQHERKFEEQSKKMEELMQQLTRYKTGFKPNPSSVSAGAVNLHTNQD